MSETNAQRLKRLRAAAVANGLCYVCRCRPIREGTNYCDHCIKLSEDRKTAWREAGRCILCGAERDANGLQCARCTERLAKRMKARKTDAAAAGLCTTCRAAPALIGRRQCEACAENGRIRKAGDRRDGREREPRHCRICGSPDHNALFHERPASPVLEDA